MYTMGLPELDDKNSFDSALKDAEGLVVVDFYADWCGPCKRIAPQLEKLASEKTSVEFYKVNVDVNTDVTSEQEISAMPTFLFFKDQKRVHEVVGASFDKIVEGVEKYC